jgi:hypothetical protein
LKDFFCSPYTPDKFILIDIEGCGEFQHHLFISQLITQKLLPGLGHLIPGILKDQEFHNAALETLFRKLVGPLRKLHPQPGYFYTSPGITEVRGQ